MNFAVNTDTYSFCMWRPHAADIFLRIFLCLFVLVISGCSIVTYECKTSPSNPALIGEEFLLGEDSFLLENSCSARLSTKKICFRIQVVGGDITYADGGTLNARLPASFVDFEKKPTYYNDKYVNKNRLFGVTTDEKRQDIVGLAPKGSVIRITNVVSAAWGESGRCYEVYGELSQGSKDLFVEMPSCALGMLDANPLWFNDSANNLDDCDTFPVPVSKYLIRKE